MEALDVSKGVLGRERDSAHRLTCVGARNHFIISEDRARRRQAERVVFADFRQAMLDVGLVIDPTWDADILTEVDENGQEGSGGNSRQERTGEDDGKATTGEDACLVGRFLTDLGLHVDSLALPDRWRWLGALAVARPLPADLTPS